MLVVVAFEGLAVATIMPIMVGALCRITLYGWGFSGFILDRLVGTVVAGDYSTERGAAFAFSAALTFFATGLFIYGIAASMLIFIRRYVSL
ncbi:MAG: hypothetical protein JO189_30505 [Deltaproteobacteria bacterium]|nr:hypothetical protein [Deltaproteobacteria bacterium]